MYRRPKWADKRISDELFEKLMEIANMEAETFLSFGGLFDHFERAVLTAASKVLDETETVRDN